jgi:hypothetical protein
MSQQLLHDFRVLIVPEIDRRRCMSEIVRSDGRQASRFEPASQ